MSKLAVVEDDGIVLETVFGEGKETLVGRHLAIILGKEPFLADEHAHRLRIVETERALQRLASLSAWHEEGRMPANLEIDFLVVGVLHVPHHVYLVVGQLIAHRKVEMVGVELHRFRVVVQAIHNLAITLGKECELGITREAVARKPVFPAVDTILVSPNRAHYREEDWRAPSPVCRVALP